MDDVSVWGVLHPTVSETGHVLFQAAFHVRGLSRAEKRPVKIRSHGVTVGIVNRTELPIFYPCSIQNNNK